MNTSVSLFRTVFFGLALLVFAAFGKVMGQVPQLLNYQGRIAVNGTNFTGTGQFKFALVSAGTNAAVQATASATVAYGFLVNLAVVNGGSGYSAPPAVTITDSTGTGAAAYAQISGAVVTNLVVTATGSGYSSSPTITIATPAQQNVVTTFWSNDGTSNAGGPPSGSVPLTVTKGLYAVLLGDTNLPNMAALPAAVFANGDVRLRVWFNDGLTGFQQLTPDQRLAAVAYAIMAGSVPDGSITASKIAPGAVGSSQLASNLTIPGTLTVSNLVINGSAVANTATNFILPAGTNIQTYVGGYYFITNLTANFILPPVAAVGDTIHIRIASGIYGTTVYNISQNPGQRIVGWNQVSCYGNSLPLACSADATRVLANSQPAILLSTDSANSWTLQPPMQPFPSPTGIQSISISSDGTHIYLGSSFSSSQGLLISKDGGQTWSVNTNFPNFDRYSVQSIACSTNGSKVIFANNRGIFISTDSGTNWILHSSAPTNANWSSVAVSADGTKLIACINNGGIYTSPNSGATWTLQLTAPTNIYWSSVASSADGTKLIACGNYGGGIYTSQNSGVTWTLQTNAPAGADWVSVASSGDGSKLAAASFWNGTTNGLFTSVNSGSTWTRQTNGLSDPNSDCYSVASSADGMKLFAYFTDGKVYSSLDMGNTWSPITSFPTLPIPTLVAVSSLGISGGATFTFLSNGELILIYLGNGMFAIADANLVYGNFKGY